MKSASRSSKPPNQIGKRFGKLTIVECGTVRRETVWVLKCDCGQAVFVASLHSVRKEIRSCGSCSFKGQRNWRSGEIAVVKTPTYFLPRGAQVIVERQLNEAANPDLTVEYMGRRQSCRASNLDSLKTNFYGSSRRTNNDAPVDR